MTEPDFLAGLVGRVVTELHFGPWPTIRIVFDYSEQPEPGIHADVGSCLFTDSSGHEHDANADDFPSFGPVFNIVGKTVERALTEGGTLALTFSDGSVVRCPPDEQFEAWQVAGCEPYGLVICCPGGELAFADARVPRLPGY